MMTSSFRWVLAAVALAATDRRTIRWLGGAALLAAIWLLYGGHAGAPPVFDDLDFFGSAYVSDYGASIRPDLPRYWPFASFAHQHLLFGHGAAEMRMGNFVLHGLCVLVLQALLARLLAVADAARLPASGTRRERDKRGDSAVRHECVALGVAALFALHPVAVYAVAYLVQRTTLMATLFALSMWLSFLAALDGRGWRWLGLSVVFYYLAVFSKQHALFVLVVPLAMTMLWWRRRPHQPGVPALALTFLLYAAIALAVARLAASLLGTTYEPMFEHFAQPADWHVRHWGLERVHWMSVLTQCALFFKYGGLWLWPDPANMSVDMREPFWLDLGHPAHWAGVAAYLAVGALALAMLWTARTGLLPRRGLLGLGLLAVWGMFLVELSTVRLQEIFVLYRSYLWMTGLAIVVAVVADALAARWRTFPLLLACAALAAGLAVGAQQRLATFASHRNLWHDAVRLLEERDVRSTSQQLSIGAERAYGNRGNAHARNGEHRRAFEDYAMALRLNPAHYPTFQSRATLLVSLGRDDEALADLDAALAIRPAFSLARVQRALLLERHGGSEEALREFKRTCDEGFLHGCLEHHRRVRPGQPFMLQGGIRLP